MENNNFNGQTKKNNGLGIAGMVLGIIAIVLSCVVIGGIIGIVGIILSIVAICEKGKVKGAATAGIVLNAVAILIMGGMLVIGSSSDELEKGNDTSTIKEVKEKEAEDKKEYISVTAKELSDALEQNAMKADDTYNGKYLKINGKLGTIDSSGGYIDIESGDGFDMTIIQCYIQSEEQKKVIMEKKKGDKIVVKGKCTDVGEIMGYSIDIESVK